MTKGREQDLIYRYLEAIPGRRDWSGKEERLRRRALAAGTKRQKAMGWDGIESNCLLESQHIRQFFQDPHTFHWMAPGGFSANYPHESLLRIGQVWTGQVVKSEGRGQEISPEQNTWVQCANNGCTRSKGVPQPLHLCKTIWTRINACTSTWMLTHASPIFLTDRSVRVDGGRDGRERGVYNFLSVHHAHPHIVYCLFPNGNEYEIENVEFKLNEKCRDSFSLHYGE